MWNEGNGACGHEFSKKKRIDSIPEYLNSIKTGIEYVKMAEKLSDRSIDELEKQYYSFEAQTGRYFVETYLGWISGMADYNFTDSRVCPKTDETREILRNTYNHIVSADFDSKIGRINDYIRLYSQHISE